MTIKAFATKSTYSDSAIASAAYTINGVAATPTVSPAAGTYTTAQAVSLATATTGASIYYTIDGSTPTTSSILYSTSIFVGVSQTIKAIAVKSAYSNSSAASFAYTITGTVQAPTFSVAAGAYGPAQTVSLSSATPGATIYYTTNGTTPTTASSVYTSAITVSTTQTIKAYAVLTDWADSAVSSATYTINGAVATPTFSVAAGAYGPAQSVTLSTVTTGATIYYTTDGSTPTASSTVYSTAISVSSSLTLKAFATKSTFSDSAVATAAYTINGSVATPTASPVAGTYTSAQAVTLTSATTGATIYYTVDGSTPTTSSTQYSTQIFVGVSQTIKAIAAKSSYVDSSAASFAYTITGTVQAPTFSVAAGAYGPTQTVSLTSATPAATIYYTTNGTTPTTASTVYTSAISVSTTQTIKAYAVLTTWADSTVSSATYTINGAVATPTFSVAAGTYGQAQSVALSTATTGATIYYTTDGTTPTTSSSVYSTAISVSTSLTIKAFATKSTFSDSGVASAAYTIAPPTVTTISPNAGSNSGGTAVTITGTGFVSGATVTIGGASATGVSFVSTTSLTATTPAGTVGAQNVVVTNPNLQTGTLTSGFTYVTSPVSGPVSVMVSSNTGTSATLALYAPSSAEMYVTNTAGCASGGVWETLQATKAWTLISPGDGTATVFAKFRNAAWESDCVSHRVSVTGTSLSSEGQSCAEIYAAGASRLSGVYMIDPDGTGPLAAEKHYCNMSYSGGGWTLVARILADNSNVAANIPTTAEYLSGQTVGSPGANKYILGNDRQGFTNWGAVVNGTALNSVSDFNGNSQKFTSYVLGTTARTCNWVNGTDFVIGTTASGACLKFGSGANSVWNGASDGSTFAALGIQGSPYNLSANTVFAPFNQPIINGADNDYCSIMRYGTSTYGDGYTCRGGSFASTPATKADYIEVYAKSTPVVSTPVASVTPGGYATPFSLTLSTTTAGATIYYTTDGTTPTTSSTVYSTAINVSSSMTVKALATKTNYSNSAVASATYTINGAVATPTFSVTAGAYGPTQSVTIGTATSGATIYYTTDGTTPTTASSVYSTAISVSSSITIKAFATKSTYSDSTVASAAYTINGAVATPTASPAAGTYSTAQSVSLSSATAGANIYYTLDGSTPTTSSTLYAGAIFVGVTQTIKAIAVKSNYVDSSSASFAYTVTGTVQAPTFSVAAGSYGPAQTVSLTSATPGATIYYTTNGTTPTSSSSQYSTPISVSTSQTIKAYAVLTNWADSSVSSASYTINGAVATPTFSVAAGTYSSSQTVTLSTLTSGASIYYTIDGSTPTTASSAYSAAINVSSSTTIKAYAVKTGFTDSSVATAAYTISVATTATVTINFTSNQTVVTPQSGGSTTTTAVTSMSSLSPLLGTNGISTLTLTGVGSFSWDSNITAGVNNVTLNGGATLTGPAYSTGDGRAATLGNGHLIISMTGTLTVNSGASINMDYKGYTQNLSYAGTNTGGAGKKSGCSAGGASYGTAGAGSTLAGSTFGASDFWTNLYLGSGGADTNGCYDSYNGGKGGGAISISAASISNAGTITAKGENSYVGSGSGGTIYLVSSGAISNTGTISTAGGTTGAAGGTGRVRISSGSIGTMTGSIVGVTPAADTVMTLATVSINGAGSITQSVYSGATATASLPATTSMSSLQSVIGSQTPALTFAGSGTFTFDTPFTGGTWDLVTTSGQNFVIAANPGSLRDLTVNGGTVTLSTSVSSLRNVTINNAGILTGSAYSSGDGRAATIGNGHLVMSISGTLTVNTGGSINMDAKGYTQNLSYAGTNTGGAGKKSGCSAGGGGYGTGGGGGALAGSTFGDSDFWTNLYLGSGGADTNGCYDSYSGGKGGGAISISAASISNAGTITARGENSSAGSGSGGTVYLASSGTISNTGAITTAGGTTGATGGNGRVKLSYGSLGTMTGSIVGVTPAGDVYVIASYNVSINFGTNQTVITPPSGGSTTTTAVSSASALSALVGSNMITNLTISGNGSFSWDVAPSAGVANIVLNSGSTLTGAAYSSGDGRAATLGNGHLIMSITGTLIVNSGASINMDAKGYTQNLSYAGTNIGGAGKKSGCSAGGASYGTAGGGGTLAGSAFGASDFWTNLYLGSGGADTNGCYDSYNGGKGGGAISISAASISNAGTISAKGENSTVGSGSGGTIYLVTSGSISNTGTITAAGGTSGAVGGTGRVKLSYGSVASMTGSIVGVTPDADTVITSATVSISGSGSMTQSVYSGGTATATIPAITSMSSLQSVIGSQTPAISFAGTGTFTFDVPFSGSGWDMTINNGQTIVLAANPGTIRHLTINSGGILTGASYTSGDGRAATLGSGHLVMSIAGTLTVNAGGSINMDAKGYTQNMSYAGTSTGGAGKKSGCSVGGGSYGTTGAGGTLAGSTFGAADFWTNLYLGSGGADISGCYDNYAGGKGGGAISISAATISNAGTISARGENSSAGSGSGGTIYLASSGAISNMGTITTSGGTSGAVGGTGRVRLSYGWISTMTGSIVGVTPDADTSISSVSINVGGAGTITASTIAYSLAGSWVTGGTNFSNISSAAGTLTIPTLTFSGTGTFTLDATPTMSIGNVTLNSGVTLTAQAFNSANGNGQANTLGNGHFVLGTTGTFTVNAGASVNMDAKGYTQNLSYQGTNTGGAGKKSGCSAGGGGYGTSGGGNSLAGGTFGSADFWTNLYLGSGGADTNGCYDSYSGGSGGGAIYISALNFSNAGTITSKGGNSSAGSGSGGTIVINVSGNFSNSGTITTAGGTSGAVGGTGRVKLSYSTGSTGSVIGQQ